jgi:hypothetical protein
LRNYQARETYFYKIWNCVLAKTFRSNVCYWYGTYHSILSCVLDNIHRFFPFVLVEARLIFFSHLPQVWSEENQVEKQPLQPANLFTFFLHLNCRFNPTKSNKLTQHQQIEHWHRNQINECSTMYLSLSISNSFN